MNMDRERLVEATASVREHLLGMREGIDVLLERLDLGRLMFDEGAPNLELLAYGANSRESRSKLADSMSGYETSMRRLRVFIVQELINTERVTMTEAGKMLGISRQAATRLYEEV